MKISVAVMAHPKRQEFFDYLKNSLSEFGDVPFSIDQGVGIWGNCKNAWRLHDKDADYHIVIQDDAIICKDFKERVYEALGKAKDLDCAASLFFGKRTLLQDVGAKGVKQGFLKIKSLHWGLAICLPTNLIEEMIAFGDRMTIPQDDARIALFLKRKGVEIYYPMPSLVDHRLGESLVNDPGQGRNAYKFIDN